MSFLGGPVPSVPAVQSWQPYHRCPVPVVLSKLLSSCSMFWLSCLLFPVLALLSWLPFSDVLTQLSFPCCPTKALLSYIDSAVLYRLSCRLSCTCRHVLTIFCLNGSVPADLSQMPSPDSPFPACPLLAVLTVSVNVVSFLELTHSKFNAYKSQRFKFFKEVNAFKSYLFEFGVNMITVMFRPRSITFCQSTWECITRNRGQKSRYLVGRLSLNLNYPQL